MKSHEQIGGESQERENVHIRFEAAFKLLREGTVGQAYWQLRALFAKPDAMAILTEEEREALEEARQILEESSEIKVLNVIAEVAGKEEKQWL
jgi:hypothetical protein